MSSTRATSAATASAAVQLAATPVKVKGKREKSQDKVDLETYLDASGRPRLVLRDANNPRGNGRAAVLSAQTAAAQAAQAAAAQAAAAHAAAVQAAAAQAAAAHAAAAQAAAAQALAAQAAAVPVSVFAFPAMSPVAGSRPDVSEDFKQFRLGSPAY